MISPLAFNSSLFPSIHCPQEIYEISLCTNVRESNIANYTYKKVTNCIKPVSTMLPEDFHIIHCIPCNPLTSMPVLPT
ncbi:hypothetical protein P691DRAFT_689285, partial [Macrolepiota fuliginosa MF-IS2]